MSSPSQLLLILRNLTKFGEIFHQESSPTSLSFIEGKTYLSRVFAKFCPRIKEIHFGNGTNNTKH